MLMVLYFFNILVLLWFDNGIRWGWWVNIFEVVVFDGGWFVGRIFVLGFLKIVFI